MSIQLTPTPTEFVDIEHRGWGDRWSIQFPEAIESAEGTIKAWPAEPQRWQPGGDQAWGYTWRPDEAYVRSVRARNLTTPQGRPQYQRFITHAQLDARIAVEGDQIALSLTLANTGDAALTHIRSEGGCFQARSDAFKNGDEVARSHLMVAGAMTSMARIDRTVPVRCLYVTDPDRDTSPFEWYWGRSRTHPDAPAMVGAVSRDGRHAVVLGYQHAAEALANSDDHHCLHSGPSFASLAPGARVTRRGWILFGDDIHALARDLSQRLSASSPD